MAGLIKEYFSVHISEEDLMDYYRGSVRQLVVQTESLRTLQFRIIHLQKFVSESGIHGRFCITYNSDGSFVSLEKISRNRKQNVDISEASLSKSRTTKAESGLDIFG